MQVVAIGADHKAILRSQAALRSWNNGTGEQGEQRAEGPTRNDPDVKAEIQYIENAIVTVATGIISKYGGVQGCSDRLVKLKGLPRSNGLRDATIDGYETWVSSRLRVLESDL